MHGAIICFSQNIYSISIYLQISMRQSQMSDCKQTYHTSVKITSLHLDLILNQAIQICVNKEAQNTGTHTNLFLFPQFS